MRDASERRLEALDLMHDAMRHLVKQDTFENASFFDYPLPDGMQGWNNDTLVAVMQYIIADWVREHWPGLVFDGYDTGHTITPHITTTLEELDMLPE